MRALVQRVDGCAVHVDGRRMDGFEGPGLLALVGVTHDDDAPRARRLADKVAGLRVFDRDRLGAVGRCVPAGGPREVSAREAGLPVQVVSQFTLYGQLTKGRRPTWDAAAPREVAEPLVDEMVLSLRGLGMPVHVGVFGAHMQVALVNDGPITLMIET